MTVSLPVLRKDSQKQVSVLQFSSAQWQPVYLFPELSHLLSLPFPYVASVLPYDFTSITILNFPVRKGEYVHPRLELFNDCAHLQTNANGPAIQQKPDGAL